MFSRMERIKISYRIMKEWISVAGIGGIRNMAAQVFAIHHDY